MPTRPIVIHAGAQPNNSPHLGTLVVFAYAFLMAKTLHDRLSASSPKTRPPPPDVEVTIVDTAPFTSYKSSTHDDDGGGGIEYQCSYRRDLTKLETHMPDYRDVLGRMSKLSGGIEFRLRNQSDFFSHPAMPDLVAWLIAHRRQLAPQLSPKHKALALRAACPVEGCGIAEKHGRLNKYTADSIVFRYPKHGPHAIRLTEPAEVARLEANAPTRNLLRAMTHLLDRERHHVRVTGLDYAGMYQEALLYRPLAAWRGVGVGGGTELAGWGRTPHILYAPLVTDWSGSKLSKSLYVREGGYGLMKMLGLEAVCSYEKLRSEHGDEGLDRVWKEVESWFAAPHKLFRPSYSIEYWVRVLRGGSWKKEAGKSK